MYEMEVVPLEASSMRDFYLNIYILTNNIKTHEKNIPSFKIKKITSN